MPPFNPQGFGSTWGTQNTGYNLPSFDWNNPSTAGSLPMMGNAPSPGAMVPQSPTLGSALEAPGLLDRLSGSFWNKQSIGEKGAVTADQGWGMPALGAVQGMFNGYLGMKQYGIAKDQLASSKQQFGLNYDAQRTTTNAQLQDRQAARVASNPGAYQSAGDYMTTNSIKPR